MAANTHTPLPNQKGTGIYAHLVGWGMAVPDGILSNEDLEAIVETSDEWIRTRTGIHERRIASDQETTSVLALKAAQRALEVADILPMELDLIIVATSTPEYIFPSTASLIQDWLGANNAGAFDLSAACSGFVFALNMAAQSIRSGSLQTALVIGAETMSKVLNWQDRGTCILFGDGAGAVVLQANEAEGGVLSAMMRSDGAGCDLLTLPSSGNTQVNNVDPTYDEQRFRKMYMAGGEVFKFATRVFAESIREAVNLAGISLEDLSLVVPHQANQRILQSAARSLKMDPSRFMSNIERYGNTSAASIPIALTEAVQQGLIHEGDYIAFVGFGAGLAWGSMVIKWGIPKPQERQGTRFNRQRRRFHYILARWRAGLLRWSRLINETINRIRPERGRVSRLRRKIDHNDLE